MNVEPKDVLFCFCYALTQAAFIEDSSNTNKNFIRTCLLKNKEYSINNWHRYNQEILKPYNRLKKEFIRRGIAFIENTSFEDYISSITQCSYKVIILFAHCSEKKYIEFNNGLVHYNRIINCIPINYKYVLDFSTCSPEYLADEIKVKRPLCIAKTSNNEIEIIFWYYIYAKVFSIICLKPGVHSFAIAFQIALEELYKPTSCLKKLLTLLRLNK